MLTNEIVLVLIKLKVSRKKVHLSLQLINEFAVSSRAEGLREGLDLDRVNLEAAVAVLGVFLTGDLGTLSASSALDGSSS